MERVNPGVALIVAAVVLVTVGAIVWSTMGLAAYTVEACVTYDGRTNCATASGSSREEAVSSAVRTACATLAGGVEGSIACNNTEPDSLRWIDEPDG